MKLERMAMGIPAWLLDGRYEIHLNFNHGHFLHIIDMETTEEHVYFDGGGSSSASYGLHNFPSTACDKRCNRIKHSDDTESYQQSS